MRSWRLNDKAATMVSPRSPGHLHLRAGTVQDGAGILFSNNTLRQHKRQRSDNSTSALAAAVALAKATTAHQR